ncbi:serine protease [Rahnella sp. GSA61A]|uniref:S1 family peptidase n=1 Tax=Rahnella sp. GSA61A TaxID=2862678 RepID=UPI001CC1509F|nr:serine protease [Rahnella sp. GSA61A]
MQNINPLSLITTLVILKSKGERKSLGTGFLYSNEKQVLFLATNFHVITGISPNERGIKPVLGDEIEIQIRDNAGKSHSKTLQLFSGDKKLWLEHPTDKLADVILIPLLPELFKDATPRFITKKTTIQDVLIVPSSPVVMIGYPHGYHDSVNNLPIWKTGSLASELEINFDGKKLLVVDISAFPGMSGSPAFYVTHNGYLTKGGDMIMGVGMSVHFLGIYASMQMLNDDLYLEQVESGTGYKVSHKESLQLGHVWKSSLIEEIADTFDEKNYPQQGMPIKTTPKFVPGISFKF